MEGNSQRLFKRAVELIPGGVNSPVRSFKAVGGEPLFIDRAEGSKVFDVDGRGYIDMVGSWGPLVLGHAHRAVVDAVRAASERGLSFGAPTEAEVRLAELITDAFPSLDRVRLVNSGTEATMSAVRLARAYTGRDLVVKFDGCYHGHVDSLLVTAGSGAMTHGTPSSPGVPRAVVETTVSVPFNDVSAIQELVESRGDDIACVIVEPVPANMGLVLPGEGYLELLRDLTREYDILLIFDEVVTGFRLAWGGAQTVYSVSPDLTCLGKIIGGGMPVGAYGGGAAIMEQVAPSGPVYQAGTLSGNPIATAAGLATLDELRRPGVYEQLERQGAQLAEGLREILKRHGMTAVVNSLGSCLTVFFAIDRVTDFASASGADASRYARFFRAMLAEGVYLAPSPFETAFVSTAHSDDDISRVLEAAERALAKL